MLRPNPLYQFICTCAIRCGSCCNNSSAAAWPDASTIRCTFVLSPLLCDLHPDCFHEHRCHVDEPCNASHQPSTIRSQAHQWTSPTTSPQYPCLASGKNAVADAHLTNCRNRAASHAMVPRFGISMRLHWQIDDYRGQCTPTPCLARQVWLK